MAAVKRGKQQPVEVQWNATELTATSTGDEMEIEEDSQQPEVEGSRPAAAAACAVTPCRLSAAAPYTAAPYAVNTQNSTGRDGVQISRVAQVETPVDTAGSPCNTYTDRCMCRNAVKLPNFDGVSSDCRAYLNMFNTVCEYQAWSPREAAVQLRTHLRGDALEILMDPESCSWTFERLVDELRQRFASSTLVDKYRYQIKTRRRQPGEPLGQLYRDLWRLGVLAHPTDQHSAIFNKFMVDCFIDSIGTAESDLGEKVRDRFPKTLREAYEISELLECKALYYTCYAETGIPRPGNTNSVCVVPSDCAEADRRLECLCLAVSRLKEKERLDVLWNAICKESTPLRRTTPQSCSSVESSAYGSNDESECYSDDGVERDEWSRRKQRFARDRHRESFQPHDVTVTPRSAVTPELTPHRREKSDGDLTDDLSTS